MDAHLIEKLRDIPPEELDRIKDEHGYTRWTYFTDSEAAQAGVLFAGDSTLAAYYPGDNASLEPGPLGEMELQSLQYVPSAHQLYLVSSGHYLTLQVFSNLDKAGQDTDTPKEWQQFLTDRSVRKMTGQHHTGRSYKLPGIAAATALAGAVVLFVMMR